MPVKSHGESKSKLYRVWAAMKARCYNSASTFYDFYGGRGITVCSDWLDYVPFRDWALLHGYAEGLEIDRRDNDGPYSPHNCRWLLPSDNCRNRRSNVWIEAFGESKILRDWATDARCQVPENTLRKRIVLGWEPERALTEQSRRGRRHGKAPGAFARSSQTLALCGRYVSNANLTGSPTCEDCLTVLQPKGI